MKPYETGECRICNTKVAKETWPFCPNCQVLLLDFDDLDMDSKAAVGNIYRKTKST